MWLMVNFERKDISLIFNFLNLYHSDSFYSKTLTPTQRDFLIQSVYLEVMKTLPETSHLSSILVGLALPSWMIIFAR